MHYLKTFFFVFSLLFLVSCSEADVKNVEVTITGMTCEIGCAKLIESKTYKLDGMISSTVSFEHGKGQFSFDNNKISVAEIERHINGIAGGELYTVTSITEVDEFSNLELEVIK